jgi:hypothetical protein
MIKLFDFVYFYNRLSVQLLFCLSPLI